jgi:hypothetical protein
MSHNPVTLVTAFFDIKRSEKGDGRTIDEYKSWIQKTLQLNCNLFIVTESKFLDFFKENRPSGYKTFIKVFDFKDLNFYKYREIMRNILENPEYKNRIAHPKRVECVLPEYNIIQYSKFHCLKMGIEENPFQSDFFFWIDAGISRFFLDVDLSKIYPSENSVNVLRTHQNKFIIQKRHDLETFPIDGDFIWKSDNLLYGTMFGGNATIIHKIAELIEDVLINQMFQFNNVNNEQLALAMIWKKHPELFLLTNNHPGYHLILFKLLSTLHKFNISYKFFIS